MTATDCVTRLEVARVRRRMAAVAGWSVTIAVVALGWWACAPVALGGQVSYVMTQGTSMLPSYEPGGLVVVRASDSYDVGDVAAYRNRELQAVVLHRIVARDGGRYVFRGDNNDAPDSYTAAPEDLLGTEALYWPGAGPYVRFLREPVAFGLLTGLAVLMSLRPARRRRRRRRHHAW